MLFKDAKVLVADAIGLIVRNFRRMGRPILLFGFKITVDLHDGIRGSIARYRATRNIPRPTHSVNS